MDSLTDFYPTRPILGVMKHETASIETASETTDVAKENADLRRRIADAEEAQSRMQESAAEVVEMAEELYLAREAAQEASACARAAAKRLRAVFDAVPDSVVIVDPKGMISSVNAAAARTFRLREATLMEHPLWDLFAYDEGARPSGFEAFLSTIVQGRYGEAIDIVCRPGDGATFHAEMTVSEAREGRHALLVAVIRDVSARRESERRILELATLDPLTGLSNRRDFQDRLKEAVASADRAGVGVGLLSLDLDRFKAVNDGFGHPVGDKLLEHVAEILKSESRGSDTVARLGGDEFAVIMPGLRNDHDASLIAERIIARLSETVVLDRCLIKTGTSIGISVYPRDADDAETLIATSDKALYRAKSAGRGRFKFFDCALDESVREEQMLENDLRLAVVRGEFEVHFQAQHVVGVDVPVAMEALVRWRHPTKGMLPPARFIPLAEKKGLIGEITKIVLEESCRRGAALIHGRLAGVRIAVNVSPQELRDNGFVDLVRDTLRKTAMPPERLELEITENIMMPDMRRAREVLAEVAKLGVAIAIDDFGSGFTSLTYIQQFPVSRLKIDKSFIDHICDDENDFRLAAAIVNLGRSLNLRVLAEGVETQGQLDRLRDAGCQEAQGFFFGRPAPLEAA